jgi:hypothetical protein
VSLLADRVLLSAFGKQIRPVPPSLVESKAKEMEAARSEGASEAGDLVLELEE